MQVKFVLWLQHHILPQWLQLWCIIRVGVCKKFSCWVRKFILKFKAISQFAEHGDHFFTAPQNAGFVFSQKIDRYSITYIAPLEYVFPLCKEYFHPQTSELSFDYWWNVSQNAGLRTTKCRSKSTDEPLRYQTPDVKRVQLMIACDRRILLMIPTIIFPSTFIITACVIWN